MTVCQNLLQNKLIAGLTGRIPNFDPASVANQGATSLREAVGADELPFVLEVYNGSLRSVWYLALGLCCLILIGSLGLEWKSVKKDKTNKAVQA